MNMLKNYFPNVSHVILPVIHVESQNQTLRNALLAREAGCDGVFLINHSTTVDELLKIHKQVVKEIPDWWVGVNCLGVHPRQVFSMIGRDVAGVWTDNACIDERTDAQPAADAILAARAAASWRGLYFGGVAFKYQRAVEDLASAARLATAYMDVVTTSGPGTGQAASVAKIKTMKQALGDFPLAIASGITPDNVVEYLDVADCFLVATGISKSWTELDQTRLGALLAAGRGGRRQDLLGSENVPSQRVGSVRTVCIVCEWNEGRSPHFALSLTRRLRAAGSSIRVISAGMRPGGGVNPIRSAFLRSTGVDIADIEAHRSTVFGYAHAAADLILAAELPIKQRLLELWPALKGRVMTIRGYIAGFSPDNETLTVEEAHIEDAGGHSDEEKLRLYRELEELVGKACARLLTQPHCNETSTGT